MKAISIIKFIAGLFILILINTMLYNNNTNWDLTKEKRHSISEETINILENLEDKIYIKIYLEGELPSEFVRLQKHCIQLIKKFNSYSAFEIEYELINPSESETKKQREEFYRQIIKSGVHPIWVKSDTKSANYTQLCFPGAIISFQEKEVPLQIFTNVYFNDTTKATHFEIQHSINQLEYNLIKNIHDVSENKKNIAFLLGNGELDSTNTFDIRNTLSEFYKVEYLDISMYETDSVNGKLKIQEQIDRINKFDAIVIAKASEKFQNLDKFLLDQYLMNGGKILWILDGTDASMNNFRSGEISFPIKNNNLNLDDLFENYGFKINNNLLQDLANTKIPITMYNGEIKHFSWVFNPKITTKSDHIITNSIDSILTEFVSNIELMENTNIESTVLLESTENSRLIYSGANVSLNILRNPPPNKDFNKGKQIVSVLLEGRFTSQYSNTTIANSVDFKNKINNGKLIIVSDGDIIRNIYNPYTTMHYPLGYYQYSSNPKDFSIFNGNKEFIINSIQYLCGDENLIKIRTKKKEKLRLLDLEDRNIFYIKWWNTIIPQIILLFIFLSFYYYRKNKYGK